jgi:undecaprenyl diphosphate synthase
MSKPSLVYPSHLALIMDGNGRWATKRGLPRIEGHRSGLKTIHEIVRLLAEERHIDYLTLFAFSTENWNRPKTEINGLFLLLGNSIKKEAYVLHQNNVRLRWLGQPNGLPTKLVKEINNAIDLTAKNTGMTVSLAFNYGGRQEIANAVQRIVIDGISPEKINEALISQYLYTFDIPDVDLLIRTADELRISNFLLWQTAYAEFYFTPVLWPDFNKEELEKALTSYRIRKRRFGGI